MAQESKKGELTLKLVRSPIGSKPWMRTTVRTLGLRKMNQRKVVPDNKAIRGMVARVSHLVQITTIEG